MKTGNWIRVASVTASVTIIGLLAVTSPVNAAENFDPYKETTRRILEECGLKNLHPLAFNAVQFYLFTNRVTARQLSYYVAMLNPEVGRNGEHCIIQFGKKENHKDKVYPHGYDPRDPNKGNIFFSPVNGDSY